MRVVFTVEARRSAAAAAWYRERDVQTTERFRARLGAIVRLPGEYPASGTRVEGTKYRRVPMTPFPYLVVYELNPADVRVLAIPHTSEAPRSWMDP